MDTTKTDDDEIAQRQQQHWTEVRETEFLDSHEYQPLKILIDPSLCTIGKNIAEGGQGVIYEVSLLNGPDGGSVPMVLKAFKAAPLSSPQGQWPDEIFRMESVFSCSLSDYVPQSDGLYDLLMP
jgi:hypothetical protein